MGSLNFPVGTTLYLDANIIMYSGERVAPYHDLLQPIWQGAADGVYILLTSELSLLEVLVGPLKKGDLELAADYRALLQASVDLRLVPMSTPILERAAMLRATIPTLKTPDAIHAATAISMTCDVFLTNDEALCHIPSLKAVLLRDILAS